MTEKLRFRAMSAEERLLTGYEENKETGCWVWQRATNHGGYGVIRYKGKQERAHRVSYMIFVGEIKKGMIVMHSCDNPSCINPGHLSIGTPKQNTEDMLSKGRQNKKLSIDDVLKIRKDERVAEIACFDYGIGKTEFRAIKKGERWGHI